MQVQVNTTSAAKSIKQFVKARGGNAKHSEILELVAGICGFDSYRAMKAGSGKSESSNVTTERGRTIEDAKHVVFRSTAVDWKLLGNEDNDDVEPHQRGKYEFTVEDFKGQYRVMMKPQGVDLDNFEGKPVLDMMIEINDGIPCAHMTNDPADEMLMTVFATGQGLLFRPDGGEHATADEDWLSQDLKDVILRNCDKKELHKSTLRVLDTLDKHGKGKNCKASAAMLVAKAPVHALTEGRYPFAWTDVTMPVFRRHVGSRVKVSFRDQEVEGEGKKLWLDVDLFDAEGVIGDDDHMGCLTRFTAVTHFLDVKVFADCMAQVVAYFIGVGRSMRELDNIVRLIADSASAASTACACLDTIHRAEDAERAFKEVLSMAEIYN